MKKYCCLLLQMLLLLPAMGQLPIIQHPNPPGLPGGSPGRSHSIAIDPLDNKWIGFANFGLCRYDGANWTIYNTTNSLLPSDSVLCITFDASGNGWVGTKEGLVHMNGVNWNIYNQSNSGLPSNIITAIECDGNTKWIGTYNGLLSFDGSTWNHYYTGNSGLPNDSVSTIHVDVNGKLWIGTRSGLARFDNGNWSVYNAQNSPLNRYIHDLESDAYGRVWIANGTINALGSIHNFNIHYLFNGNCYQFMDYLYYYDLPLAVFPITFAKNSQGDVIFGGTYNNYNNLLFRIHGWEFNHYYFSPLTWGSSWGSKLIFDNSGGLWMMPRIPFFLFSIDFNQYNLYLYEFSIENHRSIDINGVKAGVNVMGDMHWNFSDARYEVPKGSGKHSVFASAFWMGGHDPGGQVHMAANTYRQNGNDFAPGPIGSISMPFDSSSCILFNRIWKMNRWKIEQFKDQYLIGNVTNGSYTVPEEISSWPAKGNGIVNDHLAPFVDINGDGVYNPMQGDYPDIKGDQMLFYIFNDSLFSHGETGGAKLGVEVQASVYAYNCTGIADSLSTMNHTTLYHYTIINRSSTNYSDVYMGIWSDVDLGNSTDDYVGCDSTRAAGFVYNGDNDDDGGNGYGLNPPMQNIKILQGTLAPINDGMDNNLNGMIDEPGERTTMNHFHVYTSDFTIVGNPSNAQEFYYYLQSKWLNGQHVTYGDFGVNTANAPSNFFYSGVPYSGIGWSEALVGNTPEDRRCIVSSGPFSLAAGDTATLDFAFIFTRDSLNPNGLTTSIARNQADLDRVQSWFDQNNFPSCEVYVTGLQETTFEKLALYPNPATTHLFLNGGGHNAAGIPYTIYDAMGKAVHRGITATDGSINISSLPQQVYLLQTDAGRGRFVKM